MLWMSRPSFVAVEQMSVHHRRAQVVRRSDRVHVTGQMQVEQLHRHDLAVPASGRTTLDPERRPHGGLTDRDRRRCDRCAENPWPRPTVVVVLPSPRGVGVMAESRPRKLGGRPAGPCHLVDGIERDLGRTLAVGLEMLGREYRPPQAISVQRLQLRAAGDLEVTRVLPSDLLNSARQAGISPLELCSAITERFHHTERQEYSTALGASWPRHRWRTLGVSGCWSDFGRIRLPR